MTARDDAVARDLAARARLAGDPVARIVMGRGEPRLGPGPDDLTAAELDVLRYRSRGLTLEQTATAIACSAETVKQRLRSARFKLRAKTALHACCEAIRLGLIP